MNQEAIGKSGGHSENAYIKTSGLQFRIPYSKSFSLNFLQRVLRATAGPTQRTHSFAYRETSP